MSWPMSGGLADLDQVTVRVTDVTADLCRVLLRFREEVRAQRPPLLVHRRYVGHANVEEAAGPIRIRGYLERDARFAVGRPATDIDDDPAVRKGNDRRLALPHRLTAEYLGVEAPGAGDIVRHDEVRQDEAFGRDG